MAEHHSVSYNLDEQYTFSPSVRRVTLISIAVGVALVILGIVLAMFGGHDAHGGEHAGHAAEHAGHAAEHGPTWLKRLFVNLWINNVYFTGIAVCGVFFVAVQYVAWAGWSTVVVRIPQAFGFFLPIGGVLMVLYFVVAGADMLHIFHGHGFFHWTLDGVADEKSPNYDHVLAAKAGFLNTPFFLIRMVIYFALWYVLFLMIRKRALREDLEGGLENYDRNISLSAVFIIFFAVTSSMSAWDWSMSADPHWFSTMYGWYTFASWWVACLATIILAAIYLKEQGYLPMVNENHLHDLGKFMFAFSVFWTYVWFAQFMLIYYANIPEETSHFNEIFDGFGGMYKPLFFVNIFINFVFPFLALMTRESKRKMRILKLVAWTLLAGHWIDFYLNITPFTLGADGGIGFMELGVIAIYAGLFVFVVGTMLAKAPLVPKNHPMLEESLHHNQ
ncbi:MAG: quinol:cytochrome C oxidoreductase [Cytophagales bacterium]|jgi:hypothetical protein|nr:quinol:cytochrome C oxidoreductase [Cytophagales bacterium]